MKNMTWEKEKLEELIKMVQNTQKFTEEIDSIKRYYKEISEMKNGIESSITEMTNVKTVFLKLRTKG